MADIFLGLGSNMGDRADNLRRALAALSPKVAVTARSTVYESRPMYIEEQPHFYNMVIRAETGLLPLELLAHTQNVERSLGRLPETHNQPRPIDIDIILYGDVALQTPMLTLPHPRMHERAFVVIPLAEIAPLHMHPGLGKVIADLEDALGYWGDDMWAADEQL